MSISSSLAGLQPPFAHDRLLVNRQNTGFRGHDHPVVVCNDVACGPQTIAIEGRADLPAVRKCDRGWTVPRLHERRVIFVERPPVLMHQLVSGPGFRDQHHDRVGERIAALNEELQGVVETGRVRLAFIGDRPQLADVVAEQG